MRTLTVKVQIQFDQYYPSNVTGYANEVIEQINEVLNNNFSDIQAQIIGKAESTDIEVIEPDEV